MPNQAVPVEPDIFFIKKDRLSIIGEREIEGAPDLIVEILSPSSINYDREKKFEVYQAAGVPEYWLVNYWDRAVEVFVLREGAYQLVGKYRPGDNVRAEQLSGFKIAVKEIFNF